MDPPPATRTPALKPGAPTCRAAVSSSGCWRLCLTGIAAAVLCVAPVAAAPTPGDPTAARDAETPALDGPGPTLERLDHEVARLRSIVDRLSAIESARAPRVVPPAAAGSWNISGVLLAVGAALAAGFLAGTALQRYRARRARSLRF
jgi:hypothetical protein